MSDIDDGELVVVRHEYETEYTFNHETCKEVQNEAWWAFREPRSYEVSDDGKHYSYASSAYVIQGDIHLYDIHDIAGLRKLLDAIEARLGERKEGA
jgi:hypothetical protein